MAEQTSILIRKRGSIKASLTIFSKFIDTIQGKQALSDVEIIQLEDRLSSAENIILNYNEIQNELEAIVDDVEEQYLERAEFEEKYYSILAIAKNIRQKLGNKSNDDALSQHTTSQASASGTILNNVKLPTIQLPKYGGAYESWLEFRDTFESLIHENGSLTEIQKFHYLRASLEGCAAQVIKSVEFTATGYSVAWSTLCDRYNNTKLLVHNHVKALFSLESIQKESSFKIRKLIDDLAKHLRSLEQLGQNTENWDTLLIFMIASKLDNQTLREWEKHRANIPNLPTLNDLKIYLKGRADLLEALELKNNEKRHVKQHDVKQTSRGLVTTGYSCNYCEKDHSIYKCEEFLRLSINDRLEFVKKSKLCENCIRKGHNARRCKMGPCRKCKLWHNTLLHGDVQVNNSPGENSESSNALNSAAVNFPVAGYVFLSTAHVKVIDKNNKAHRARALLDCGSQSSFITKQLCEKLGLKKVDANLSVFGIANSLSKIRHKCIIDIGSLHNEFETSLTCFILSEITNVLPSQKVDVRSINIPDHVTLADPGFFKPGQIDILIGADLFWVLLCSGKISCGNNQPALLETRLGWVVSGAVGSLQPNNIACNVSTNLELHKLLSQFWEIEEIEVTKPLSDEEILCETNFKETTRRTSEGRFVVSLPLKQPASCLGESKCQAEKRFYSTERKLVKNDTMRARYQDFMSEYESLGHMNVVQEDSAQRGVEYYMPHHGVLREDSLTTKLRVVFDASAPSSNGLSLNSIQLVGPVLQDSLLSILLRFRKHAFVITADIAKMYRQVLVEPMQRNLQKIIWRSDPSGPLKSYTLNTVTYGHASSSFLAIRCLFALADECENLYPEIARIIRHDFYVDDLLTGADTIAQASEISQRVSRVLTGGCFELRKWYSNNPEVLNGLGSLDSSNDNLEFAPGDKAKTLGLMWSCQADQLFYNIQNIPNEQKYTKRLILSHTARIFDPLGLLSPCTIIAKIIMQRLWAEKTGWDEALPNHISTMWIKLKNDIPRLNELTVPRRVLCNRATNIDLHGFSDASSQAYGACIYLRSVDEEGEVHVNLLCAKAKVAPIKTLTIPRLELCAALLLARLADTVIKTMNIVFNQCTFWSDSTITLAWISTSTNVLKTFVANRVSEIQTLTKTHDWKYVPTQDNPSDLASRGLYPSQILDCSSWWYGPPWLKLNSSNWPTIQCNVENLPELKVQATTTTSTINSGFPFNRFSKFLRLKRVTAYLIRFKNNCLKPKCERELGSLTITELNYALKCLVKSSQRETFQDDFSNLVKNRALDSKSKMFSLTPFLDEEQIIRVGGRLKNSDFAFEKRHPIILHSSHCLTKLLFQHEHVRLLHAGPQLLLSSIRQDFWPISGRTLARGTVRKCLRCFRFKSETAQPIMGNLPRDRTTPSSPFLITGVDYAGPFLIRNRKGRGSKLEKCYVSVFVCFTTKAIHLELVSSLSTDSFILALRRFIARRGKPLKVYSDNGKNFVGAQRELGKFIEHNKEVLVSTCTNEAIEWIFIPPYSPHFGGLWEAGVKSVKHHLKRVLAQAKLIFEEFTTILAQIEAILNSRPLCPMSADPSDFRPLSPAHFLIGRSLVAAPDENLEDVKVNRLTRFQLVQRLCQHFWQRWGKEYVSELQQRTRWKSNQGQLADGALVLIKDDQTMPTDWRLGRIVQLHKGSDGVARVASIRTRSGVIKRSFKKICPLPLSD